MAEKLLEIRNLQKKYPIYGPLGKLFPPKTHMRAVADVSLRLRQVHHRPQCAGPCKARQR